MLQVLILTCYCFVSIIWIYHSLSISLLMDIWIASRLAYYKKKPPKLLRTSVWKPLYRHMLLSWVNTCKWNGWIMWVGILILTHNFTKNYLIVWEVLGYFLFVFLCCWTCHLWIQLDFCFQFGWLLFFLPYCPELGCLVQCWVEVVRVNITVLFLILRRSCSL